MLFRSLPAIIMETSDHSNLQAGRIFGTVVQLFRWIALNGELHIRHTFDLMVDIVDVIKNRACEHGFRYKGLVKIDAFWDEKRLGTLKDARRATQHHHVAVEGIAPLIDGVKTGAKKEIKSGKSKYSIPVSDLTNYSPLMHAFRKCDSEFRKKNNIPPEALLW